jgi:hypothetical protein
MATRVNRRPMLRAAVALAVGGLVAVATLGVSGALEASIALPLAPSAEPPKGGFSPDPPSTPSNTQRLFDVRVDKGKVSIEKVRTVTVKNAEATARVMGRYALELWIGNELLDRIRFNVPLGADLPREDDGRPFRRPSFDRVTTRFTVKMADHPRAVYAKLVDRATGAESKFLWPPRGEVLEPFPRPADAGPAPRPAPDAGAPRDAGPVDGGAPRDGG